MACVMSRDMYEHIIKNIDKVHIDLESGIITTSKGTHGTDDNSAGYLRIRLAKRLVQNHQIIAVKLFGEECIGKQINHKDGNKKNNKELNLELSTPRNNTLHAISLGLMSDGINTKLSDEDVREIRKSGQSSLSLSKIYGVKSSTISRIRSGERRSSIK